MTRGLKKVIRERETSTFFGLGSLWLYQSCSLCSKIMFLSPTLTKIMRKKTDFPPNILKMRMFNCQNGQIICPFSQKIFSFGKFGGKNLQIFLWFLSVQHYMYYTGKNHGKIFPFFSQNGRIRIFSWFLPLYCCFKSPLYLIY